MPSTFGWRRGAGDRLGRFGCLGFWGFLTGVWAQGPAESDPSQRAVFFSPMFAKIRALGTAFVAILYFFVFPPNLPGLSPPIPQCLPTNQHLLSDSRNMVHRNSLGRKAAKDDP